MELRQYFESARGHGVLATADREGSVSQAVFARPHVLEDGTIGFIMPERRTYRNLQQSPYAAYLFIEEPTAEGSRYQGRRLKLRKVGEELDTERVRSLRRRTYDDERDGRYLVTFEVAEVLPLIGEGEPG